MTFGARNLHDAVGALGLTAYTIEEWSHRLTTLPTDFTHWFGHDSNPFYHSYLFPKETWSQNNAQICFLDQEASQQNLKCPKMKPGICWGIGLRKNRELAAIGGNVNGEHKG